MARAKLFQKHCKNCGTEFWGVEDNFFCSKFCLEQQIIRKYFGKVKKSK